MDNLTKIQKTLENIGAVVLKVQEDVSKIGKGFKKFMDDNDIDMNNIEEKIQEISRNLYENTKKVVDHNSQYGWTLAGSMSPMVYIDLDLLEKSVEELDEHFYHYYSEGNWKSYGYLKQDIIKRIDPKWSELIDDCFFMFENDRHKSAIPILFTIVEGELATTLSSNKVGSKLVLDARNVADNQNEKMKQIVLYSIFESFEKAFFIGVDFKGQRGPVINRNRVAHGRDNPKFWSEVDVLKLLTVLSSILLVQEIDEEEDEEDAQEVEVNADR